MDNTRSEPAWKWIFKRKRPDLFRICIDYWVLTGLYYFVFPVDVSPVVFFLFLYISFGFGLIFQLYYAAFQKIYQVTPVLYKDWYLLRQAFLIFFHDYSRKNILITIVGLAGGSVAGAGLFLFVQSMQGMEMHMVSKASFGLIAVLIILSLFLTSHRDYPYLTFQSPLLALVINLKSSFVEWKRVRALTVAKLTAYNQPRRYALVSKPDLYFIVVESYGRVLYDMPGLFEKYLPTIRQCTAQLSAENWYCSSNMSIAPVTGGASWISYTSMLYGLDIGHSSMYWHLYQDPEIGQYDSLFWWLKRQGYCTFRLVSLGGYETMRIPYDKYSNLYGIDHWIKYPDLEFEGQHYGFGPSPPDQFAIWKAREIMLSKSRGPKAFFFITQNSHSPYASPSRIAPDWRDLNHNEGAHRGASKFWSRPNFEHYGAAIRYQLEFLTDFILKAGKEQDVFILVGDHQPPSMSAPIHRFETPIHIVSRNKELIAAFDEYGFLPGLEIVDFNRPIRQSGIYSALLRALVRVYGQGNTELPPYLPNGIPI